MDDNMNAPTKSCEPYVGMPIYLDDDDMLEMNDMMDNMNEMMDGNYQCSSNFENWPLAMAYVPMQSWEEVYTPEMALQRGTIFPCLDLPFMGGAKR